MFCYKNSQSTWAPATFSALSLPYPNAIFPVAVELIIMNRPTNVSAHQAKPIAFELLAPGSGKRSSEHSSPQMHLAFSRVRSTDSAVFTPTRPSAESVFSSPAHDVFSSPVHDHAVPASPVTPLLRVCCSCPALGLHFNTCCYVLGFTRSAGRRRWWKGGG